jgi:4'-phosphopantetheinyl transferase
LVDIYSSSEIVWGIAARPDSFPSPSLALSPFSVLDQDEQAKFLRFSRQEKGLQFLFARVFLRWFLSFVTYQKILPEQWAFSKSGSGKPIMTGNRALPLLHFNLSHADQLVVVAVSAIRKVGIDIEQVCAQDELMIDAALSPEERVHLCTLAPADRAYRSLRIWTIKEAYAKMTGEGLILDFSTFEIEFSPLSLKKLDQQGQKSTLPVHLRSRSFSLHGREYLLSLASCPA